MKIVKVIHGYPMRYNAGSEVYSPRPLCHGLAGARTRSTCSRARRTPSRPTFVSARARRRRSARHLHVVNNPRSRDRYRARGVDQRFAELLDRCARHRPRRPPQPPLDLADPRGRAPRDPDRLYPARLLGHVPSGQFMQMFTLRTRTTSGPLATARTTASAPSAATHATSRAPPTSTSRQSPTGPTGSPGGCDTCARWSSTVDLFIAPARYLEDRYRDEFGLPERKLVYLDYGFDRTRLAGRQRARASPSPSATSARTSPRRASTTSSRRSAAPRRRPLAHLGPPARSGHRGARPSPLACPRRQRARRVAARVPQPGDRARRLRPRRRDRRPLDLGRELAARHP
jgi:hypothetical protein